jgi:hypothetical protein
MGLLAAEKRREYLKRQKECHVPKQFAFTVEEEK